VVDDCYFEFEFPAHFALFNRAEGTTQWADPARTAPRVVMVIQSMMRTAGNTLESVATGLIGQVQASAAARLVDTATRKVNGVDARTLHFTLDQGTHVSHFKYAVLDMPGPNVITVSFVGPTGELAELDRHYQRMLATVRPHGRPPTAPAAANLAATSREAWEMLNNAAASRNWAAMVQYLDNDAVEAKLLPHVADACRRAGRDPATFRGTALERLQSMLEQVPEAAELVRYLSRRGVVFNVREENDSMHLVMAKFDAAGHDQHYFWMRKINGKWVHTPN
jgi:hypothetical protein